MPRIKIKQLEERVATVGLFFGGSRVRRKLCPGEVVEIPEGKFLTDLMATGKLELTMDPVSRPLDYATEREAQITSPTFKARGPAEQIEIDAAKDAVAARLVEQVSDAQPEAESPAEDLKPTRTPPQNRRAARRARIADGQEATA